MLTPFFLALLACGSASPPPETAVDTDTTEPEPRPEPVPGLTEVQGMAPGGVPLTFRMRDGLIVDEDGEPDQVLTPSGVLVPAVIDAHVHIVYTPQSEPLARSGVVAAVDLAAPIADIGSASPLLTVVWAGPMVTATAGYPTQSWGANGYGIECASDEDVRAAVASLVSAGAGVIKYPITGAASLSTGQQAVLVTAADEAGLPVFVHALTDAGAAQAAAAGAHVLAHTPTEPLAASTVAAWSDGAVVSTLSAFGNSQTARDNLKALADSGTTVLYGTDLGNTATAAIDPREIAAMAEAGLTPAQIIEAATAAPARVLGLDTLGALTVNHSASFLVLPSDPLDDIAVLATPTEVWLHGARVDL